MREPQQGGVAWDVLAEAVPAEDGEAALSINRYFVEHPEMVLWAVNDRSYDRFRRGCLGQQCCYVVGFRAKYKPHS